MKRCLLILPLLLALGSVGQAQQVPQKSVGPAEPVSPAEPPPAEPPPPPTPSDEIVTVVPPSGPMTTNIAFIVDTSGSMDNHGRVGMAVTFANSIIGRPGDQLMVALLSFKATHTRWPGMNKSEILAAKLAGTWERMDGPPPPKGWTYFPGVPQLASAQSWLNNRGASGGTDPVSAINEVLAETVKDLSIVLITDGEDFDVSAFTKAVVEGQSAREKSKLGRAIIFVIGIGKNSAIRQHLMDVGKAGGGGFFVVQRPKTPPIPLLWPDPNDWDLDQDD